MTNRRTAIMVAVAVAAGATIAGIGLATQGSSKAPATLQVDEQTGRVGVVVLGETDSNVVGVLGPPRFHARAPGSDSLLYTHLVVGLRDGRVVSIRTDDPAARTDLAVRIGDPLSAARASYRKAARCNPSSPDKTAKNPFCSIKVGSGTMLIAGDPIQSITLVRTT
jgi:hypothetical protein